MTTRFVITGNNNRRIAYDVTGSGMPVILLHGGLIHDRSSWHNAGFVERLSKEFSVIAIDLRGHGDSDAPERPEDYSAGKLLADVQAVADACGAGRFILWGYSFGGTVALQAASRSERVIAAVIGGSYFGPILTSENFEALVSSFERMIAAKEEGRLDDLRG
ncbi:MAG: alpha/beta fold hydrolase, partial [Blastocatellia bacterium]